MKTAPQATTCRGIGKITLLALLAIGAVIAAYLLAPANGPDSHLPRETTDTASARPEHAPPPSTIEFGVPTLEPAAPYLPAGDVIKIDVSEYAGYAGLIVANGGLAPSGDSFFARNYGFRVELSLSEGENWSALNAGKFAASATTVDALAVLGRQFQALAPVQFGFSRGADMVVVDRDIGSVNQLKGKLLAASRFNESDFFIRYLAQEAGLAVHVLTSLDQRPDPERLGVIYYDDAFTACDAYAAELTVADKRLNGCVGWTPRTEEVVAAAPGAAKVLVSNRNLLIVADLLMVNKGFAQAHPEWVKGLVHGILEGNRQIRQDPNAHLSTVANAFGWSLEQATAELGRVHLANLPENLAFFSGSIDAAASFSGIFQASAAAYGDLLHDTGEAEQFVDTAPLSILANEGRFTDETIGIAPIRTTDQAPSERKALLSKDIRFLFAANSAGLDPQAPQNAEYLDTIKGFLQVSPGSVVMLRGHVDGAKVPEFRAQGGEALVQRMAAKATELSTLRAETVRRALLAQYANIDPSRVEVVGRGWEEPAGTESELNRRVEVQWFTLE